MFRQMLAKGGGVGFSSTLYVDGGVGNDATGARGSEIQKFKTIQAAINAAIAGDVVRAAGGTYSETLVLKSDVDLIGESRRKVLIDGDVSWTPVGAGDELPSLQSLTITGALSMDGTGKSGGLGYLYCRDVSAGSAVSSGRPGANEDGFYLFDIDLPENDGQRWQVDVSNGVFVSDVAQLAYISAHGDALVACRRTLVIGDLLHDGTGSPSLLYSQVNGNVNLNQPTGTGPFQEARRTIFYGTVSVADPASTWDAYDCTFEGSTGGSGTINRNDGDFVGTDGVNSGRTGLVPAPSSSDQDRFLRGDGGWRSIDQPTQASITTSNATPTSIWSFALSNDTTYAVEADVVCVNADGSQRGSFKRKAMVSRTGPGAAVLDPASQVVGTDAKTDPGLDAAFAVSGNDVDLMVTGLASPNVSWKASIETPLDVNGGPI